MHMKFWSILRKCCGSQASQDQRLALHTAGLTFNHTLKFKHAVVDYDYPACEVYQLDEVEGSTFSPLIRLLASLKLIRRGRSCERRSMVGSVPSTSCGCAIERVYASTGR